MEGARIVGVRIDLLVGLAFALAGAIAAVAAIAAAPSVPFGADTGTLLGLKGLVAAAAVGFSTPLRAFAAGLVLGVVESAISDASIAGHVLGPQYATLIPVVLALALLEAAPAAGRGARGVTGALARTGPRAPPRRTGGSRRLVDPCHAWRASCSPQRRSSRPRPGSSALSTRSRAASTSASRRSAWGSRSGSAGFRRSPRAPSSASAPSRARWPACTSGCHWQPRRSLGALAATGAGLLVGAAIARLRRALIAVATLLLSWACILLLQAFPSAFGGSEGLPLPPALSARAHYELALALLALSALAFAGLARGPAGLRLAAARDRPPAAAAAGVPIVRLRTGAFGFAAGLAGLVGGLSVDLAGVADPSAYGPALSFKLLVAVVIGGAAAALGGPAGIGLLGLVSLVARNAAGFSDQLAARFQTMTAAVLVVLLLPAESEGILPWLELDCPPGSPAHRSRPDRRSRPVPRPNRCAPMGLSKRYGAVVALDGRGHRRDARDRARADGPERLGQDDGAAGARGHARDRTSGTIALGSERPDGHPGRAARRARRRPDAPVDRASSAR